MTELEERIKRAVAVREFDSILMAQVRTFEARKRQADRTKQWAYCMTLDQKQELFRSIDSLKNDQEVFRLDSTFEWMQQYPNLSAPSFTPSAIRKRVSRRRAFEEFHRVEYQGIFMKELKRILSETQELVDGSRVE